MSDLIKGTLKTVLILAAIFGVFAGLMKYFYVDIAQAGDNSMAPTLLAGDQFLVWRGTPDHGRATICAHPKIPGRLIMGRVVGKPGHTIEIDNKTLIINGTRCNKDIGQKLQFRDGARTLRVITGTEVVGNDEHAYFDPERPWSMKKTKVRNGFYLLGDNRAISDSDSRTQGEVPMESCKGTIFMRLQPVPNDLGNSWLDLIE